MTDRRRLFFALEPADAVRREVHRVQQALAVQGRAVIPEQFHVTLAFLGMQPAEVIPVLQSMASRLVLPECTILLDRIGRFSRTGVLWLGASDIPPGLDAFHLSLVEGLERVGVDRDRKPWEPHLTLYRRLRKPSPIMPDVRVVWPLDGFSLIESVSVKSGVEYRNHGQWRAVRS
jgi:2'-5' RNA ligase